MSQQRCLRKGGGISVEEGRVQHEPLNLRVSQSKNYEPATSPFRDIIISGHAPLYPTSLHSAIKDACDSSCLLHPPGAPEDAPVTDDPAAPVRIAVPSREPMDTAEEATPTPTAVPPPAMHQRQGFSFNHHKCHPPCPLRPSSGPKWAKRADHGGGAH